MGTTVDAGGLIQFGRDVLEERAQHPDCEGLVDCHEDGDHRPRLAVEGWRHIPEYRAQDFGGVDEPRQVACDKHRMRQRAEDQSEDQQPEREIGARARKAVACQRAHSQGYGDDTCGHQHRVAEVAVKLVLTPDGNVMLCGQTQKGFPQRAED